MRFRIGLIKITLVDKISKALDEGKIMIGVFLDLKYAFDCVDHSIKNCMLMVYEVVCMNGLEAI